VPDGMGSFILLGMPVFKCCHQFYWGVCLFVHTRHNDVTCVLAVFISALISNIVSHWFIQEISVATSLKQ
jgi:hypothetical protein